MRKLRKLQQSRNPQNPLKKVCTKVRLKIPIWQWKNLAVELDAKVKIGKVFIPTTLPYSIVRTITEMNLMMITPALNGFG